MSGCIAGCQYIPSVEYFAHWKHHGLLLLEREEHYQKRTWRNKTAIQSPDLPLELTVPLRKGKNNQTPITEVRIAYDTPWQKHHLHSLKTAYGKTAYIEELLPGLEQLYQVPFDTLWNLNIDFIHFITSFLHGAWPLAYTSVFRPHYEDLDIDLRSGVPCGHSLTTFRHFPEYPQVQRIHKTHQSNLCILDALCHLGPETTDYLSRYGAKLYEKP
jgi:hypothetical protein